MGGGPEEVELGRLLGVAQIYVILTGQPTATWEMFTQAAPLVPDATLTLGTEKAIKVGGAYTPTDLSKFHSFCSAQGLTYEVW